MLTIIKSETKCQDDISHSDEIKLQVHVPQKRHNIIANEYEVQEDNERRHNASTHCEDHHQYDESTNHSYYLFKVEAISML